jgi:hypothetical protein
MRGRNLIQLAKDIIQNSTAVNAVMNLCDSQIAASFIACCEMAFCFLWIFKVKFPV